MTTHAFRNNAVEAARALALAPVLVAALIGAIPLLIPCVTCRCCQALIARIREAARQR